MSNLLKIKDNKILLELNNQIVLGVIALNANYSGSTLTPTITVDGTGTIDWGDGTSDDYNGIGVSLPHTYSVEDTYSVVFYGTLTKLQSITSGSNLYFNVSALPDTLDYYYFAGVNTVTGVAADLPRSLTYYRDLSLTSTLSGDIGDLPPGLVFSGIKGSNTLSGNIANLPTTLTDYYVQGQNTTTGDLSGLTETLTYFLNYGSNTTSGELSGFPSNMTYYSNLGLNTTTGDIADLPSTMIYYWNKGRNTVDTYTSGHTFSSSIYNFRHEPYTGYGLTSTMVDNLLIDLDTSVMSSGSISLTGNNAARTTASDTAVSNLQGRGVTVDTN